MIIWKWEVVAQRWPWQSGYDWKGMKNNGAPLNAGGARFGGGWKYKLGLSFGGSTLMIDLLFGIVKVNKAPVCPACNRRIARKDRGMGLQQMPVPGKGWISHCDLHKACIDGIKKEGVT